MIILPILCCIVGITSEGTLLERAVSDRNAYVKKCVEIINSPVENKNHKGMAYRVLGVLRATEASAVIIDHINERAIDDTGLSRLRGFPAARALKEIGSSCVPALFIRLNTDVDDDALLLIAVVLIEIDGREIAIFRTQRERELRLKKAAEEAKNNIGVVKSIGPFGVNVDRLLDKLDSMDPNQADPLSGIRKHNP